MLYLDSSAIVKLVARERETQDLVEVLRADPAVISSALAWTEVIRAVRRARGPVARASEVLDGIAFVPIDEGILRAAADLEPLGLRTLDAIHVATALSLREDISGLVVYDRHLAEAAVAAGIPVVAPGVG
ncbi:MAG TPA: type II toxin-antitoxin system VapC family toxin [Actinomycetota bacterium]|nr:type II toxin-antitoxin system VapC family toxin [Actinomycetota bacterium]